MDPHDLRIVGVAEITEMIGVSRQRVYQMAKKSHFPKPYGRMAQGQVWNTDEIEAWIAEHRDPDKRRAPRKAG